MEMNAYLQKLINWCLSSGLHIALVLILTLIALKAAKVLSKRLVDFIVRQKEDPEFQKRTQTLASIIRYVSVITILLVGMMMVLKEFGIEIGPLLAAAGIAGLAVGFGAQSLVKDVISGFFILLEDQIRVGDVVQIAGKGGLVEKINLKTTILRDLAGNVHYVPNGHIDVVTNMTKDYSRYVFDIGVAYRENVDEVIGVIKYLCQKEGVLCVGQNASLAKNARVNRNLDTSGLKPHEADALRHALCYLSRIGRL